MTACVKNHSKRVALAISASLVGALSLGAAAPAVAEAAGIESLTLDTNYVDSTTPVYKGSSTVFHYNGQAQGRVPEKVVVNGDEHDVIPRDDSNLVDGNFYYYYVEIDGSGSKVMDPSEGIAVQYYEGKTLTDLEGTSVKDPKGAFTTPVDRGDYAVVIGQWKDGKWSLRDVADTFSIVGFSLDDAVLCDSGDVTDTTFEMSPKGNDEADWTSRLSVAVGNHVLDPATDYSIDIVEKNGAQNPTGDLKEGVTYQAVIDGKDKYEGHKVIDFTVSKLDLSTSAIVGATLSGAYDPDFRLTGPLSNGIVNLNGVKSSDFDSAFNSAGYTYDLVATPDDNEYNSKVKGAYTYKVTATETNPYATGSKEFTVVYADSVATVNFADCGYYDGRLGCYFVNNSLDKPTIFDISHVAVSPAVDYDVTVCDSAGNEVDMGGKTQLDQPGTYYVKVDVFSWGTNGKLTAGSDVAKVVVAYSPVIADSDVFMSYKGDNVESMASDTYDGSDLSKNMAFTVKSLNKTLVQGTDYTVTFERQDADGKRTEVDSVVDAGTYIITVEGKTYSGKAEFTFVVNKAALKPVLLNAVTDRTPADGSDGTFLPYTGSPVPVEFAFESDGKAVELPAGSWSMTVRDSDGEKVDEVVKVGDYTVTFDDSDVQNYDISDPVTVSVEKAVSFADVKDSDWFVGSVYQAKENGYVKGVSGTSMYAPNQAIKRCDAVVILARMAGMDADLTGMSEEAFSNEYGYYLDYSDVATNAYYARAVAWATKVGVVHGDAGATTFRPEDTITREEFAAMLSNYAAVVGREDISVDTDAVLASAVGADTVSPWMRDAVAWAYANGVMGNNGQSLDGHGNITRAQTAAMAVNYQAEPLK